MVCRGPRPILLPSSNYTEWHKESIRQLKEQGVGALGLQKVSIVYEFLAKDNRAFDTSNKEESVNDLLVDYGFLEDDNWKVIVSKETKPVTVDKVGGVKIVVTVLD